ncbi:MAG: chemotaxis protein CheX [Verrucomicrobiota bacterium]
MDVETIEVFVKGASRCFAELTKTPGEIGTPFLKGEFQPSGDYTGAIGITGCQKGVIALTVSRDMLVQLLDDIGGFTVAEQLLSDLVGEMANIISGNARESLGSNFMISVPVVVDGNGSSIHLDEDLTNFIIPITWKDHTACLSIHLREGSEDDE